MTSRLLWSDRKILKNILETGGAGVVICLERGADDSHMVQLMPLPPIISCFIKMQNGSAFLVLAYSDCPGKEAVKWVLLF